MSPTTVVVRWRAAWDNVGVRRYLVLRNGRRVANLRTRARRFRDHALAPDRSYTYVVRARDAAGNLSPKLVRQRCRSARKGICKRPVARVKVRTLAQTGAFAPDLGTPSLSGYGAAFFGFDT